MRSRWQQSPRIGNSLGLGRVSGSAVNIRRTYGAIADQARAGRRASLSVRTTWPVGIRSPRGPIGRPGGTDAHAERPRTSSGHRGEAHWAWWAAAGRRVAPGPGGPWVEGGLRAAALAAVAARARRCARIWSITDAWVMNAMIRMGPRHVEHARGSTSKICCSSAAHWRVASVGARRTAGTIAGSTAADSAVPRIPRGRFAYQP